MTHTRLLAGRSAIMRRFPKQLRTEPRSMQAAAADLARFEDSLKGRHHLLSTTAKACAQRELSHPSS